MQDKNDHDVSAALELLAARLGELEVVLGTHVRPVLGEVQQRIVEAIGARDRGDAGGAVKALREAMGSVSRLAETLDPAEAALMRALAASFGSALERGDEAAAREKAALMMEKSGAVQRKKS